MRHFLHCSHSATNATEKCRLKSVRNENRKTSEVLIINDFGRYSCGGRIRTCDLQVMSLASYQLLHSAMFSPIFFVIGLFLFLRLQRYILFC